MSRPSKPEHSGGHDMPQYYQAGYPYQIPVGYQSSGSQRPSSAGVNRSRSAYRQQTGASNLYNPNPLSTGISGYNYGGYTPQAHSTTTSSRPGSAGHSRPSSNSQPYLNYSAQSAQQAQPQLQSQTPIQHLPQPKPVPSAPTHSVNMAVLQQQQQQQHQQQQQQQAINFPTPVQSRPKSAGGYRRPGEDPVQQYYLQSQGMAYKPTSSGNNTGNSAPVRPHSATATHSAKSSSAVNNQPPSGNGGGTEHWNTSYNMHYGYGSANGVPPAAMVTNNTASNSGLLSASAGVAQAGKQQQQQADVKVVISNGTGFSSLRPSSANAITTSRLRQAITDGQKIGDPNVAVEIKIPARTGAVAAADVDIDEDIGDDGDVDMGLDAIDLNQTATARHSRQTSAHNSSNNVHQGGRQILARDDDDEDEMDGKRVTHVVAGSTMGSRSHPEVSTTTPSQSLELGGTLQHDVRNNSVDDSFADEDINVGLPTLPNQFCTKRDAVGLKKLILMSNSNVGGIAPSSSAVMDMYMVGKVIGVGSYGKVRAAWHRLTTSKVAIKTYDKAKMKDPAHWKRVYSEIKIMEQVSHPRIARMYEAIETPKRMHLIMECLDGGNLCSYVKAKRRLSEEESKRIFFQILQAVEYLHSMGVTHRDIKLENVLFVDSRDIKLIDFGFSTVCQPGKRLKVFCGTPSYMAPEIVRRTEYEGKPVDMWSLGILLYALLCGCFPFRAKTYPDLYRRIARGIFVIPDELGSSVKDLLNQLLCVDISQRITSQTALRHSWVQQQLLQAPDMAKLKKEMPTLISDRPADDIDEETLLHVQTYGIPRDEVIRAILSKIHSSVTTLYYLLLEFNLARRKTTGGVHGGGSSGHKKQQQSIKPPPQIASSNSNGNDYLQRNLYANQQAQPQSQQPMMGGGGVINLNPSGGGASSGQQRPKSATGTYVGSAQRPLSAYATRR